MAYLYIYLDIVEGFACQMCGTCCRNDWMVTLDKTCYDRNRHLFQTLEHDIEFERAFQPLLGQAGPGEYAYIVKQPNGACWFLGEDQLCRLQRQAGHSHLDSVCQTFPRYPMNTARGIELTLSFSCPAVLEMACRTQPIALIRSDSPPLPFDEESCVAEVFPKQKPPGSVLRYYFELEQHLIDIVQCRAMPLEQRIDMLRKTVSLLEKQPADETVQCQLDSVFRANYESMDCQAASAKGDQLSPADILIENMLVNLIFKKVFYLYGLSKASLLLERIWRKVNEARRGLSEQAALNSAKTAVRDIEFRYGHDRKALLKDIGN